MGFFSNLLGNIIPAVTTLFGGAADPPAPVAAPAVQPAPRPIPMVREGAPLSQVLDFFGPLAQPGDLRAVLAGDGGGAVAGPRPRPITGVGPQIPGAQQLGFSGGNGKTFRRTFVQTVDIASGQILRNITLQGAPFLMNKEVNQLRRTARKLGRANAKIPRRTVKESLTKQLTDAALTRALGQTRAICPPKDC